MRAGESGARIAPEPIDTRKKKESRATIDPTLSVMQCPTLLALFRRHLAQGSCGLCLTRSSLHLDASYIRIRARPLQRSCSISEVRANARLQMLRPCSSIRGEHPRPSHPDPRGNSFGHPPPL
jgi:hypothetical protein